MTSYKVTVLIAVYRAAAYVESKIASLLQQTAFNDAQIILLNCQNLQNESTLFSKFVRSYKNVVEVPFERYIKLYGSWNIGIQNTDSIYITNSNMDDQWHPQYLEKCMAFLDENPEYGVVSSNILVCDKPNQVWPEWNHCSKLPSGTYPSTTAGPCPVWRRSLHEYGLFGDYRTIGDARLWEKWYAAGVRFGLVSEDLVLYYISSDSLERRRDPNGISWRDLDLAGDNQ